MKYSLIGINEGIEELTLTLLIGIKTDLLQFILYPDKLLKLSNSLIILETETSKWSKYKIISSAYNQLFLHQVKKTHKGSDANLQSQEYEGVDAYCQMHCAP